MFGLTVCIVTILLLFSGILIGICTVFSSLREDGIYLKIDNVTGKWTIK